MSKLLNARRAAPGTILFAVAALAAGLPAGSLATIAPTPTPHVTTGGVKHVRGSSGELEAVVDPNGVETSYYFEYGPTVAYGKSTKPAPIGKGTKGVKVGQAVTGIVAGYHYRAVAVYTGGLKPIVGKDKSFVGGKSSKLRFDIPKGKENEISVAYGGTAELEGGLTGLGNTSHGLILQGDPYPYTSAFSTLLGPLLTNLSGHFTFKIAKLTQNTQFRILTTDTRPLYSSVITIHVTPKLILHVRPAGGKGKYRLYGTVSPGRLRGTLVLQELKPQKANSKREGPRAHAIGLAPIKKGTSSQAKFSTVVTLSGTSHYRVYLKLPKGALDSGHSNNVLVHAPKAASIKKTKHAKKTRKARKTKKK